MYAEDLINIPGSGQCRSVTHQRYLNQPSLNCRDERELDAEGYDDGQHGMLLRRPRWRRREIRGALRAHHAFLKREANA